MTKPELFPMWKFVCYLIHSWEEDQVTATWTRPEEWAMHYGWNYDQPKKPGQRLLLESHKHIMDLLAKRSKAIDEGLSA